MKKRILSLLLVFAMVLGMLPTTIFAAEGEETAYPVTITAPAGSEVSVGTMHTYYVYTFAEPKSIQTEGNQVVYGFEVPTSRGNAFVRVQHPEGVTYWDYTNLTEGTAIEITEDDLFMNDDKHDSDTIIRDFSEYVHDVADVYINANAQGYLPMNVGGSFEFNVFRDWHAVEGIQNAKTALPDVSYQVIDINGNPSDVVTVVPDENNSSVANMTANKAGTAIVLVTYDAMYSTLALRGAIGTDTAAPAFFSAIWPENTGVLVVTVGEDGSSIQTNMKLNNHALDAEHDVIYYLGEEGASYTFTPETGCEVSVARAELTADSLTYNGFDPVVANEDGSFTVSGLTAGSHIVKVEKDSQATYQVICTKQTTATVTREDGSEVTQANPANPGEKVTVQLGTVYNPVNKLSGIYNSNCGLTYMGEDKSTFLGGRGSGFGYYLFASDPDVHKVTVTLPAVWAQDTYALNGYFGIGGFGSGAGAHRALKYSVGQDVQTEAKAPSSLLGRLPEIVIPVNASERIPARSVELNKTSLSLSLGGTEALSATVLPAESTDRVVWSSSNASIAAVDDNGVVTGVAAGEAIITAAAGDVSAQCAVTVQETVVENTVLTTEAAFYNEVYVATMDLSEIIISGVELAGEITGVNVMYEKNVITATDTAAGSCTVPLKAGEYETLTLTLKPLLGLGGLNSVGQLRYYCNGTLSDPLNSYEDYAYTVSAPLTWQDDKAELVVGLCNKDMNKVTATYTITLTRELPEGLCAVVLPEVQTGYTIVPTAGSQSPVEDGDSYSFTVEIAGGYEATDAFAVKANGVELTDLDGYYTIRNITEKQIITVEGVSVMENNVIYRNGVNGTWGRASYGWVETVSIGGAVVDSYVWNGDICNVTLNSKTPKDAKVYFVLHWGLKKESYANRVTATLNGDPLPCDVPSQVVLKDGTETVDIYAQYNSDRYSGTKQFVLTVAEPSCVYENVVKDKYLVSAADCENPAVYIESCIDCGEKGTETFTHGTALGHKFDDGFCIRCDEKQPGYVDPDPETVTVTLSLSRDAAFMTGKETDAVMAFRDIVVPYFDLANYGLEEYYFSSETYGGDGSGAPSSDLEPGTAKYAKDKITLLHLYIYALERFYCGVDEDRIGQGYLYNQGLLGTEVLNVSGSQGSIFLVQFWGYDCNMNYYVNHEYPLASDGWGATADQILLRDGDMVTLGSFTSWNFFNDPATIFNYLSVNGDLNTHEVSAAQGDKVTLTVYRAGADMGDTFGTAQTVVTTCPDVYYTAREDAVADVTEWTQIGTADENGQIVLDTTGMEPGQYLVCLPGQYGEYYPDEICSSPGGIILTVEPCEHRTQEPIPAKAATCTATGLTEGKKCSVCGEVTVAQEEIPAKGHSMTKTEAVEPTTEAAGNKAYWTCDTCGKLFADAEGVTETTLDEVTLPKLDADVVDVTEQITALPAVSTITLSHAAEIKAAYAAYQALTEEQKALVSEETVKVLEEAVAKIEELEEAENDKPTVIVPSAPSKPVVKPVAPKMTFSDVSKADWFYNSVKEAYENGLIDGMSADTFDPNGKLTVAQAIKLAAALHQLEKNGKVTLKNGSDVWYSTYVAYAINNGIIDKAYGELSCAQMNAAATRSEFVAIFHGAKDFYAEKNTVADNAIPDVKMTDKNAAEIYEFYRAGILTGNDAAGTFAPNSSIKRSEVATILIRMFDISARQSVSLK